MTETKVWKCLKWLKAPECAWVCLDHSFFVDQKYIIRETKGQNCNESHASYHMNNGPIFENLLHDTFLL